ncbi:hypothetical protein HK413_06605 [Mucilaginibacter sp. S1162]|uniref:Uncharacterized protein n=1 Tax=Mucilaginibacter humi TaxID=2732510 RepID=A0ABX1W123_9SPHI|nr:hypothetical protein [Mucilaginibacter humi]
MVRLTSTLPFRETAQHGTLLSVICFCTRTASIFVFMAVSNATFSHNIVRQGLIIPFGFYPGSFLNKADELQSTGFLKKSSLSVWPAYSAIH